ncbi:hypothetical protein A9Q73_07630 [Bermanella sp. 47_1433_sub80_T6]|nr:hypothetical protein A9Q73_07630 [Bermanella sp. 47_1433_sub80_T6]
MDVQSARALDRDSKRQAISGIYSSHITAAPGAIRLKRLALALVDPGRNNLLASGKLRALKHASAQVLPSFLGTGRLLSAPLNFPRNLAFWAHG